MQRERSHQQTSTRVNTEAQSPAPRFPSAKQGSNFPVIQEKKINCSFRNILSLQQDPGALGGPAALRGSRR